MNRRKSNITSFIMITLGVFIFSATVNSVVIPNRLGEGGLTGLSVLLYYISGLKPAITTLAVNVILLIVGWRFLERRTLYWTFYAVIMMSIFLEYIKFPAFIPDNTLLAGVFSGVLMGFSLALVILGGGTTAGFDIIAKLLEKYFNIKFATSILLLDSIVIIPYVFEIGLEKVVITLIMTYITSRVMDYMLEGANPKKSVVIISDKKDDIAKQILKDIDRGITVLNGYGYYSKTKREVLYTVISNTQLLKLQKIIYSHDPSAFVVISDVQQVVGEGFTFYLDDNPVK